ncbi:uncharacterized protein LODBEIA_P24840 [Lodderomyces beijingensis]|uniref:DNA 3'-5' helicase n=1 Tax=Lodderomyces beijingensis TaxID=1775926 RepID=A0ABP0ZJE6_9ASCO
MVQSVFVNGSSAQQAFLIQGRSALMDRTNLNRFRYGRGASQPCQTLKYANNPRPHGQQYDPARANCVQGDVIGSTGGNMKHKTRVGQDRNILDHEYLDDDHCVAKNSSTSLLFIKEESSFSNMPQRLNTSVLPADKRCIFPFKEFNEMQSKCFNSMYNSSHNCVLSSPTGSGKTVLFELAILRELPPRKNEYEDVKALYLAPTKALCSQKQEEWSKKFEPLGIKVGILTGDSSYKEAENVRKSQVIISTPEKWDVITRKWRDYKKLFGLVKILLVDEVHILKESRGATLEVVITRMKRICKGLRILAISATVANALDISQWIGRGDGSANEPAETFNFGDEYRAVKLEQVVYGFKPINENEFSFDLFLSSKLIEVITKHSKNKPVLIFCPTRSSCQNTAKFLLENFISKRAKLNLNSNSKLKLKDGDLMGYARGGVGYHHAGLVYADRKQIESAFSSGEINYLCCTSTLAMGINLPAYLVIIKGTRCWSESTFQEYAETDILQMIGRAGRPQFEDEGVAVIMTNAKLKQKYERVIQGTEKIESSLHLNFSENLVVEIAVGNIKSVEDALAWVKTTYFYVRFLANPYFYDIPNKYTDPEKSLLEFCKDRAAELINENMITESYECTAYAYSMTLHYVSFQTMKLLTKAKSQLSVSQVLDILSRATEFSDIKLKHQEKRLYKEINNSPIMRFPCDLKEMSHSDKVKIILQYELGGSDFPTYNGATKLQSSFLGDKFYVFKHAARIMTAILDVFVERKDGISLRNSSYLMRCIQGRCWEGSPNELRQLEGVGPAAMKKFVNHHVLSLADAKSLTHSQIEYFLGLKTGASNKIKKSLASIPVISLDVDLKSQQLEPSKTSIRCNFLVSVGVNVYSQMTHWNNQLVFVQISSDIGGHLVDFRRIPAKKLFETKTFELASSITSLSETFNCQASVDSIASVVVDRHLRVEPLPEVQRQFIEVIDDFDFSQHSNLDDSDKDVFEELKDMEPIQNARGLASKGENFYVDKATQHNESATSTIQQRAVLSNGNYECNHSCKDKSKCRHMCCREGVLPHTARLIRRTGHSPVTSIDKKKENNEFQEEPVTSPVKDNDVYARKTMGSENKENVCSSSDSNSWSPIGPDVLALDEDLDTKRAPVANVSQHNPAGLEKGGLDQDTSKSSKSLVHRKLKARKRSIFDISSDNSFEPSEEITTVFSPEKKKAKHQLFVLEHNHDTANGLNSARTSTPEVIDLNSIDSSEPISTQGKVRTTQSTLQQNEYIGESSLDNDAFLPHSKSLSNQSPASGFKQTQPQKNNSNNDDENENENDNGNENKRLEDAKADLEKEFRSEQDSMDMDKEFLKQILGSDIILNV